MSENKPIETDDDVEDQFTCAWKSYLKDQDHEKLMKWFDRFEDPNTGFDTSHCVVYLKRLYAFPVLRPYVDAFVSRHYQTSINLE